MPENNFKISFEPKKSINYRGFLIGRFFSGWVGKILIGLLWLIASIGLLVSVFGLISANYSLVIIGLKLLVIFVLYKILTIFFYDRLKRAEITLTEAIKQIDQGQKINLADLIHPSLFRVIKDDYSANSLARKLIDLPELKFVLLRAGISRQYLKKKLKQKTTSVGKKELILYKALQTAQIEKHNQIRPGDLFVALCLIEPTLKDLVYRLGLETLDLLNIVYWYNQVRKKPKKFLATDGFNFTGGVGKNWVFGYTRYLNRYATDLTKRIKGNLYHLKHIAHDKAIKEMEKGLAQYSGHNVIIVGDDGSGKRTSVYGLARKIATGQTYNVLAHRHLLEVDLESLLAGASDPGAIIKRLTLVLNEAVRAGNIILYFDKITNLFSSKAIGQVNAAEVLIPYLNSPDLFIIGTALPGKYHRYIANNSALSEKFKQVELKEPDDQAMIRIMEDTIPLVEKRTGCFFTYQGLKEVIKVAGRYIFDKPNPQKSINLMDKVAVENRGKVIEKEKVQEVASAYYKVPVGEAGKREKKKLLNLEDELHKRIVNQDLAIQEISQAMRRARAGIGQKGKKPIGSFLFLGPTGVGKTETAKALAENYYGHEDAMFRFDMSEFQNQQDVYRLLGSPEEGGKPGLLNKALKEKPFSLFLFDEIEKAHPDILNLFLQILDEGVATDTQGNKLVFKNTIIIGTSNAGAEFIRQKIKEGMESAELSEKIVDYLLEKQLFRPEFINRFTSVISFSTLTRDQVEQIAKMKVDKLIKQIKAEKDINLNIEPQVVKEMASRGYNPEMGARPMERTIKKYIENLIAKKILADEIDRGGELNISVSDLER